MRRAVERLNEKIALFERHNDGYPDVDAVTEFIAALGPFEAIYFSKHFYRATLDLGQIAEEEL